MKNIFFVFVLLFSFTPIYSQHTEDFPTVTGSCNNALRNIVDVVYANGFIRFRSEFETNPQTIFEDYKNAFELGPDDEMLLYKTDTNDLGWILYRFKQVYKGVEVSGKGYTIHSINGKPKKASGSILKGLNLNITPALSENTALSMALNYIGAQEYMWVNNDNQIKEITGNPNATYYPSGDFSIVHLQDPLAPDSFTVAYSFTVASFLPHDNQLVVIDANTGAKLFQHSLGCHGAAVGTANTRFSGVRQIDTEELSNGTFRLKDVNRNIGIYA
ncbi:MAG: hypothetical protein H0X62_03205 [Bacteroidetes bacterium]|nr:hypothetical protein [Bacteroidota bacterium]